MQPYLSVMCLLEICLMRKTFLLHILQHTAQLFFFKLILHICYKEATQTYTMLPWCAITIYEPSLIDPIEGRGISNTVVDVDVGFTTPASISTFHASKYFLVLMFYSDVPIHHRITPASISTYHASKYFLVFMFYSDVPIHCRITPSSISTYHALQIFSCSHVFF